jgi:hypothetical protein
LVIEAIQNTVSGVIACLSVIKGTSAVVVLSHLPPAPGHAGAGGARRLAMSDRISWNIWRGTATSAI